MAPPSSAQLFIRSRDLCKTHPSSCTIHTDAFRARKRIMIIMCLLCSRQKLHFTPGPTQVGSAVQKIDNLSKSPSCALTHGPSLRCPIRNTFQRTSNKSFRFRAVCQFSRTENFAKHRRRVNTQKAHREKNTHPNKFDSSHHFQIAPPIKRA